MSKNAKRYKKDKSGSGPVVKEKFQEQRAHNVPTLTPKTENQKKYIKALQTKQIVIPIGDSGVGKTFIAAWWAAKQYLEGNIRKIIITRPYVQMGKDAGAIPGTDFEKLEPYLKPILLNLSKFLGSTYQYMVDNGVIEVVVTEKIRGRSFDERCVLIGDEMQNASVDQMKAISTRIGENCQMILCGDPLQTDVKGKPGNLFLKEIAEKYNIEEISSIVFTSEDCVRAGVVKKLLKAFAEELKNK